MGYLNLVFQNLPGWTQRLKFQENSVRKVDPQAVNQLFVATDHACTRNSIPYFEVRYRFCSYLRSPAQKVSVIVWAWR